MFRIVWWFGPVGLFVLVLVVIGTLATYWPLCLLIAVLSWLARTLTAADHRRSYGRYLRGLGVSQEEAEAELPNALRGEEVHRFRARLYER